MKNLRPSTLLNEKFTFNILDSINGEIEITENPFQFSINELFTMAARINKKRSFLFVSKVLGKHIPIDANKGLLTAALLAARFMEKVKGYVRPEKEMLISLFLKEHPSYCSHPFISKEITPIIIGFAETATALGHAFFDCFEVANYFHTTREEIPGKIPEITFEEEHSHATAHRCYIPCEIIDNHREIILVDDEITTGKTTLNIIRSIHRKFPRKHYAVVSILDWRSEKNKQEFKLLEKELGITIQVVSLLAGKLHIKKQENMKEETVLDKQNKKVDFSLEQILLTTHFTPSSLTSIIEPNQVPYIQETGRFGLSSEVNQVLHQKISSAAHLLKQKRIGKKTLCLGTGEFMYLPMKLAAEMGSGVSYQSTTRSPIYIRNYENYGAKYGLEFPSPENQFITNYVYNIPPGLYDDCFIFFERIVDDEKLKPLLKEIGRLQLKSVKLVFFSEGVTPCTRW
ncbi:phosphoribosyltransferase family protein [Neobacillus massiliamazoniensis]|uniref:Adenine/guanine phosphoribosyltransferase n=1 Tax=Neobacillus massiliamazoniensis TaxID=1499688 RepID=A0A0U1P146_9BACI|nr:phosphoribosyltransferase family protein [Neobacillus massiliamazoniensis]CRK83838.1 hypothetical protein BN000_03832 [Neobacillus massiliamazoniensis]